MPETAASPRPARSSTAERRRAARGAPSRRVRLTVLLALGIGAALRLLQYLAGRSLWLDEALLAESVLGRGTSELLLRPLAYGQTAPPGFLLLQKLSTSLLGAGEFALRLVPLVAGLAALLWFPRVARGYLTRGAVPLAVALFALAPFLVYYASEAKQYALDALAAVAVLHAALWLRAAPAPGRWAAAAAVGAAAAWLSQPAVFVLAGVGAVLGIRALRRGDAPRLTALAAVGALWGATFGGAYLLSRASLADPEYMRAFWSTGFPDGIGWGPRALFRLFREPFGVFGEDPTPLSALQQWAALAAFVAGAAWMAGRGRGERLALLVAPALLALAAAALRLYPFGADYTTAGRLLLFLLPALVLVTAQGTVAVSARIGGRVGRGAGVALGAALLASPLLYAAVGVPHLRAELRPLLEHAARSREAGDLLYVHYAGAAPFRYYAARTGWGEGHRVGRCARLDPRGYLEELETLRPPRLWVLFVDDRATSNHDDRGLILTYLEHRGRRTETRAAVGAALYRYDLRLPPAREGAFAPRVPTFPALPTLECRGPWGER